MTLPLVGRRLQEGSLYLLLLLLPISKAAIEITSVLLVVGWVAEHVGPCGRTPSIWTSRQARTLFGSLVAVFVVFAASVLVSGSPDLSIRGLVGKWLQYFLIFLVVADLGQHPAVASRAIRIATVSLVIVLVWAWAHEGAIHLTQSVLDYGSSRFQAVALLQQGLLDRTFQRHPAFIYQRMTGPYQNPSDLATYLMVMLPIMLAYMQQPQKLRRYGLGALTMVIGVTIIWTQTFGAIASVLLALLTLLVLFPNTRHPIVVVLLSAAVLGGIELAWSGHWREMMSLTEIGKIDRLDMWRAALGMIHDRPVLGHGLNTFMANYLTYWVGGEYQPRYAHNCYLQVAAETGLLGLGSFVAFLGVLFMRLKQAVRHCLACEPPLLTGLMVGLFAFALQAAVDTNFYALRQAALFWSLAGLAAGWALRPQKTPEP